MYLYKSILYMSWPYDDRGGLIGENIWEPEPRKTEIIKLASADVLTTQEANRLLAPFIKSLPSFDEMVTRKGRESTRARVEALSLEAFD